MSGDRSQALLAALAAGGGRAVPVDRLVDAVWGDDVPANTTKALQVLVSRTRSSCGADAVVRDAQGYRLGTTPDQVDALRLADLIRRVRQALAAAEPTAARDAIAEAVALTEPLVPPADTDDGALAELRRTAATRASELTGLLGRALSASGEHAAALPRLTEAFERDPTDEAVLAGLLRSEAAVRGTAAALGRYEQYRAKLRDRLGVDPGADLQRTYQELLSRDRPVRAGCTTTRTR